MQDDPPEDEPEESQSDSSDVDDNDATEISEAETEKPNTGDADSNGVEEPAQSLVLGDSLAGDIESIVASDIFVDEANNIFIDDLKIIVETDVSGSVGGLDTSGIIEDDKPWRSGDIGSHWEFPWPDEYVDLDEFLNDVEGENLNAFHEQRIPILPTVLTFSCFLVVIVSLILLISMFLGYV